MQPYDPSAAFAAEEEQHKKEEELARMYGSLETTYRKSIEATRHRPPPETVLAYHDIYGHWPSGWPPWEENPPQRGGPDCQADVAHWATALR